MGCQGARPQSSMTAETSMMPCACTGGAAPRLRGPGSEVGPSRRQSRRRFRVCLDGDPPRDRIEARGLFEAALATAEELTLPEAGTICGMRSSTTRGLRMCNCHRRRELTGGALGYDHLSRVENKGPRGESGYNP